MRTSRADRRAIAIAATLRAGCLGLVGLGLAIGSTRAHAQADAAPARRPDVAAPAASGGPAEPAPATLDSLSARYKLVERYALSPDPANPAALAQYQVATRETIKVMREQPQGTPERSTATFQVIYSEKPARINNAGGVTDSVRRYEAFRMQPAYDAKRSKVPLLEKLAIWYRNLPGQAPQVFSLTEGRSLRESEYNAITTQIFFPQLVALLPTTPKRVGDTWRIPRKDARALLGVTPQGDDYDLTGTLREVRKGSPSKAIINVSGLVMLDFEPTKVNAQLVFTFDPKAAGGAPAAPPAGATAKANRDAGAIEARGSIDEVRLAMARSNSIPEGDGRLKQTFTREVVVGRRPSPADSEALAVPTLDPDPKSATAWVTYDDPRGRFHFRHPQSLQLPSMGAISPDEITLVNQRPAGPDVLIIKLQQPVKDPSRDRKLIDPEEHGRQLDQEWRRQGQEVLPGAREWLPDADWAPLNRKVYRIEAALQPKGDAKEQRIYLDYYLVLFERNQSMVLTAMTKQDPHLDFRAQAEEIIKTFKFGTSDGSPPPDPPAQSAPAEPAPRASGRDADAEPPPARPSRPAAKKKAAPRPQPEEGSEPSPFPK